MSHRKDLEKVLEYLVNEDTQQAASLLHKIVVEKARDFYEQAVEEDLDLENDDEQEVDEAVGGDEREDFIGDIKSDSDEIDADEMFDDRDAEDEDDSEIGSEFGDEEGDEFSDDEEGDIDDKVEDLEAQLAALKAQFDTLIAGEEQEPNHAGLADELDDAEDEAMSHFEGMMESSRFSQEKSADLKGEGKLAGTGAKSKAGSVDKKSMLSKAPSKVVPGAEPVKFAKKVGNGKEADKSVQDLSSEDNIGIEPKKVSEPAMGKEGKLAGTGAKSKAGSVDKKTLLSKAPRK